MSLAIQEIDNAVLRCGGNDSPFQFRNVREMLHIEPGDKKLAARVYNRLHLLKTDGIVKEVSSNRKRHKYYTIADEERLRLLAGASRSGGGEEVKVRGAGPSPGGRLAGLEDGQEEIKRRLEAIERTLADFMSAWS